MMCTTTHIRIQCINIETNIKVYFNSKQILHKFINKHAIKFIVKKHMIFLRY